MNESREYSFFGNNYNTLGTIVFTLFKDGVIYGINGGNEYVFIHKKSKNIEKLPSLFRKCVIHHHFISALEVISSEFDTSQEIRGRIWKTDNYPILAMNNYRSEYKPMLFLLLNHLKINDKVYADNGIEKDPKKCLIPIEWVSKYFVDSEGTNIGARHWWLESLILLNLLSESKQVGNLYHFTYPANLINILSENQLAAFEGSEQSERHISLTRNKDLWFHGQMDCRITLDGDKLSQKYRIKPYQWGEFSNKLDHNESEERIWSKNITPAIPYIKEILIGRNITRDFWDIFEFLPSSYYDRYEKYDWHTGSLSPYFLEILESVFPKYRHLFKLEK